MPVPRLEMVPRGHDCRDPSKWDFPHVTEEAIGSRDAGRRVGGFRLRQLRPDAGPLEDFLGVMPEHWADWGMADRFIETHVYKRLPCNWKAAAEAFLEAYHVRETHSTGQLGDEVTTQYDVFGDNVSRFIHTTGSTARCGIHHVPKRSCSLARQSRGHRRLEAPRGHASPRLLRQDVPGADGRDVRAATFSTSANR